MLKNDLNYPAFLKAIKRLRIANNISQIELSKIIDMPQSFVSKYETGERRLDLMEVRFICKKLNMNLKRFIENLENEIIKEKRNDTK
jgi:transcriptional regulator with XRE-family HTH domain